MIEISLNHILTCCFSDDCILISSYFNGFDFLCFNWDSLANILDCLNSLWLGLDDFIIIIRNKSCFTCLCGDSFKNDWFDLFFFNYKSINLFCLHSCCISDHLRNDLLLFICNSCYHLIVDLINRNSVWFHFNQFRMLVSHLFNG